MYSNILQALTSRSLDHLVLTDSKGLQFISLFFSFTGFFRKTLNLRMRISL